MAYREKQKAALVIQLAWRKYIQRRRQRAIQQRQKEKRVFQVGSEEWRRELAALVIQLAWRQFLRRRLLRERVRRQRILHEWSPSVLAARQRALVENIYSEETWQLTYKLSLLRACRHTHTHDCAHHMLVPSPLHTCTPSGQEMKMVQYFPPKPKPMVRPAYMQYIPSPAGEWSHDSHMTCTVSDSDKVYCCHIMLSHA